MNQIEIRQEILNQKERFLQKCSADEKPIFEAILDKKAKDLLNEKKQKSKNIAEATKELLEQDFVKFEDESSLTIQDMLLAKATRNMLLNPKTTFKDINEIQKVIDNDITSGGTGLTVVINTHGQDLGD